MHVGLIGGIGPAATDFYYRGLIDRHVAAGLPLDCTIAHADVREMSRNLNAKTPPAGGDLRRPDRAHEAAGAEVAAGHLDGRPFLHQRADADLAAAAGPRHPAVDAAIRRSGLKRIGVLGTRTVMETQLYGGRVVGRADRAARRDVRPGARQPIRRWPRSAGSPTQQREVFFTPAARSAARGAEAIMLGGTDLFLAFAGRAPPSRWSTAPTSIVRGDLKKHPVGGPGIWFDAA
jgi:aspartate racemase